MVGVSQGFFDAQAVDKIFDFIKCFSIEGFLASVFWSVLHSVSVSDISQ